jgi:hypothetical protein
VNLSKNRVRNKVKQLNRWAIASLLLLTILLVWISYQFKDENRFAVLTFYGKGFATNQSKEYALTQFSTAAKNKVSLLAEQGDLLGFNDVLLSFDKAENDSIQIEDAGDSLTFVNGKVNTIILSDQSDLLPWFRQMKKNELTDLKRIYFKSVIPDAYIPFLKEIARLYPQTALGFEENDAAQVIPSYLKKANFFQPKVISAYLSQSQLSLLNHWKSTESLYLALSDSVIETALPALPLLKQCIITGNNSTFINASFFKTNQQLKKVSVSACLTDYGFLAPLKSLEQLTINNQDCNMDLALLKKKLPKLNLLLVSGTCAKIHLLTTGKKLRWLGLPKNTSQQEFNTICAVLPDLQVLEFRGNDSISNLEPLHQLRNLKGLVIRDKITDLKSLYSLKDVRYLSVPDENKTDKVTLQALEKALPGCIIVPNSGACLGSGWLLFIIPATFLFSVIFDRKLIKLLKKNHYHEEL